MFFSIIMLALLQTNPSVAADDDADGLSRVSLPPIEVKSQRVLFNTAVDASLTALDASEIRLEAPSHPNELFDRVPGAWITRGSGQEHLSAIRSPVFTGAGACGAFMVLEDGIPTRPSGFCNINQLFEVNTLQARRVDVLRGPGTVTYGSNALHGAIDVSTQGVSAGASPEFALEAGSHDFYRASVALSGQLAALQANYTDAGSFRDDEGYRHGLVNMQFAHGGERFSGRTAIAYARLSQDTAGFILGKNSYRDEILRTQNLNPDAFRDAWAARASSRWNWQSGKGHDLELTPYARSSRMEFLQHFLPGTPLENNGQDSVGLQLSWADNLSLDAGLDLEWAKGTLVEFQEHPVDTGSAFLRETRPQGFHYDYAVKATTIAGWAQWQREMRSGLQLTAGLRVEHLAYDYNNRMLDGNTRDDGSVCGFGGCLYTRPADRQDSFTNISPELGVSWALHDGQTVFLRASRGYRAPQATELYRLQRGQSVADLDSETLDSLEIGLLSQIQDLRYELIGFVMRKDNFIFRDAQGYNISDGKTRHAGIESSLSWQATDTLSLSANVSWARHEYASSHIAGRGEIILKGNEIDTAPPWLGAIRVLWQDRPDRSIEAEWVYQGGYFLDAANQHRYTGHNLLNIKGNMSLGSGRHGLDLRLTNLFDTRYAERGDFAFGNYRYFPGAGRQISLEWRYRH